MARPRAQGGGDQEEKECEEEGQWLKVTAFWDTVPCSRLEADRRFRGAYCLHHHVSLLQQDYTAVDP
jgi:hypothetical protein